LIGFVIRPYLSNPRDPAVNAEALTAAPNRWLAAHIVITLGLVLTVLSILAIRFWLSSHHENVWSFVAVTLVATGATGLVLVVGYDGVGGWAVADAGGDVEAYFASGRTLEGPLFVTAAGLLGLGLVAMAIGVVKSGALGHIGSRAVVAGVITAVAVPLIPVGWAVYAQNVAAGVASWPIAWRILRSTPGDEADS
jgi:hypothetical protein